MVVMDRADARAFQLMCGVAAGWEALPVLLASPVCVLKLKFKIKFSGFLRFQEESVGLTRFFNMSLRKRSPLSPLSLLEVHWVSVRRS